MQRLLIVSNRLPINVTTGCEERQWNFKLSSGGLVSALAGFQKTMNFIWIGWPGIDVNLSQREEFSNILLKNYSSLPVFIDQKTSHLHYNGFSNSTIWPLFHYLLADTKFDEEQWNGYKHANQIFSDYISDNVQDGDIIWIHDYHLMLLPEMLKSNPKVLSKNVKIGFFLHIPFPTSEVFRVLPYRNEIIEGLLNADLVGFHTYEYARHFLTSCTRILGLNSSPTSVEYKNRIVKVGAYPVGVEPENFEKSLEHEQTISKIKELTKKYEGLRVIIGVERLDYIKGLTQKLLAFEEFLSENPEYVGKIILIQVAIPTRTDVAEYQKLQNSVFELVGRINGKLDYYPVQFIYNSVSFHELVALYRIADVCLVTSTRDGMNLVAYEYIATQQEKHGVLILSEFAGAAQSLKGAILINPWNIESVKHALLASLNSSENQKLSDHSHLFSYVKKFTSVFWGTSFVEDLITSGNDNQFIKAITLFDAQGLITGSEIEAKQIIICSSEIFQKTALSEIEILKRRIQHSSLWIFWAERKEEIKTFNENWFNMAENGIWINALNSTNGWKQASFSAIDLSCCFDEKLINIINYYKCRVPRSEVFYTPYMISWSFKNCDPKFSQWISSELQMNLEKFISHLPLKIYRVKFELRIMHSSVDFLKIASASIKSLLISENITRAILLGTENSLLGRVTKILSEETESEIINCVL